jgi:hypothetical protein
MTSGASAGNGGSGVGRKDASAGAAGSAVACGKDAAVPVGPASPTAVEGAGGEDVGKRVGSSARVAATVAVAMGGGGSVGATSMAVGKGAAILTVAVARSVGAAGPVCPPHAANANTAIHTIAASLMLFLRPGSPLILRLTDVNQSGKIP